MPSDQPTQTSHAFTQPKFEKYLVLAAGMATYDGASIEDYQTVLVSAADEEEALLLASRALASQAGFVPVCAHTATELRELADALCAQELAPCGSYNLTMEMTGEQVAEWERQNRIRMKQWQQSKKAKPSKGILPSA